MHTLKISTICLLILGASGLCAQIYVNDSATGTQSGESWQNAFTDLNNAISASTSGDEIWMAEGTYIPTTTGDRYVSFVMKEGVEIYGGFDGTETSRDERDWENNKTILSGELGDPNSILDNSIHVIRNKENGLTEAAVLDGVYITQGNCNEPEPNNRGGGIFNKKASPTIRNCVFYQNYGRYGAAIYNLAMSHAIYENCLVVDNHATVAGGAVYNFLKCEAVFNRCVFSGNTAEVICGGMFSFGSNPILKNSLISGNRSETSGAIHNTNATELQIVNTTIAGNYADSLCGGIVNVLSTCDIKNSIVWGNDHAEIGRDEEKNLYHQFEDFSSLSFSIIEGIRYGDEPLFDGTNIENDPLFFDPIEAIEAPKTGGSYELSNDSKMIDRGYNEYSDAEYNLNMNPRIFNGDIDLGAYENMLTVSTESLIEPSLSIAPNPVSQEMLIRCDEGGLWNLRIYDADGRLYLFHDGILESVQRVDVSEFPVGVYFVSVKGGDGFAVKRVVKV